MMIQLGIVVFSWIVFLLYWAVHWRNVKPTKETHRERGYLRPIAFVAVILSVVFSKAYGLPLIARTSLIVSDAGAVLSVVGLTVAVIARKTLADNWSSSPEVKQGHELVTTGIYRYMRNPIYTGMMLMGLGAVLAFPSLVTLVVFVIASGVYLVRVKQEEELMVQTFPKTYPAYKKRVKALIPFVW